jgi:hypothetical protein
VRRRDECEKVRRRDECEKVRRWKDEEVRE